MTDQTPMEQSLVKSPQTKKLRRAAAPRNHRELAEAILAECDPVEIGRELLESGAERGSSVRARVLEMLTNWRFGKPKSEAAKKPPKPQVRLILDMPAPARELEP